MRSSVARLATVFATTLLVSTVASGNVEISAKPIQQGNTWTNLLFSFAPALLIIGLYVWIFRRAAKQAGGWGQQTPVNQGLDPHRKNRYAPSAFVSTSK